MREMMSLRDAMDRLFQESFVGPNWSSLWSADAGATLALDVYETDDNIIVTAPVAGVKPEDIDVSIVGNTLTIQGETKAEEREEKGSYIRQERRFGAFQRTVTLPTHVQAGKTEAVFENGVLHLTLPKAEEAKPKSIKVKVK
jgi:HSP20 family protein